MKKLLSTLSIIGITGAGASNGLIGSLSNIHVTNNNVSDAIDLDISEFTLKSNDNIYDTIRYQLAKEGNTDSYSIKYDSKINLEIHFGSLLLPENTLAQFGSTYKVTVTVADGDEFYNATTKEVEIPVGLDKTTLDITTFTLTTGDSLYADLENDALAQAPNGVSLADIQADQEMFIEAFEGSSTTKLLPKDTKVEAGKSYTVESAVSSKDEFFKESDQVNHTITQTSDLVDIKNKYFNPASFASTENGAKLFNEVRTQMGTWANPPISGDAINDSGNITITIKDQKTNTNIPDFPGSILAAAGTYIVGIAIGDGDQYFIPTATILKYITLTS